MWYVRDVRCSGCGMFGMWDVWDVGCGMFARMWYVDLQNAKTYCLQFGYKLVCLDAKFIKTFKIYLGKDAIYNFINSMI